MSLSVLKGRTTEDSLCLLRCDVLVNFLSCVTKPHKTSLLNPTMTAKNCRVNVCMLVVIVGGLEFAFDGAVGDENDIQLWMKPIYAH